MPCGLWWEGKGRGVVKKKNGGGRGGGEKVSDRLRGFLERNKNDVEQDSDYVASAPTICSEISFSFSNHSTKTTNKRMCPLLFISQKQGRPRDKKKGLAL
jgi:hypothetical protein